ncbi:EfeM/EfeO family lipoprotein [Streptomyces sp. NL15-2K]|uniref:EfeM/EfeO family lipoprotein n=1 Tax=Streptomyces sp. NL15-2K TaxID=376149 RepID=UPI000F57B9D3|nr:MULTISPECIES: EfeM/EfeO family lipoprotein [Actinomycetes]WKX07166.1 EfeM/EfeO family lipoprotein [Kutzneria buriramensis]GCB53171.1 ferrous iron transport permease efeU [Streptomyces sp. NL15-2K]
MPEPALGSDAESGPVPPPPGRNRRRAVLRAGGTLVAAAAVTAGALAVASSGESTHKSSGAGGLRHTSVEVTPSGCGRGWTHPAAGRQVFDLRNTSSTATEVYLTDPRTGAVYGEVEGLAPGTVRPLRVTLGDGTYAFKCLPDDADAVTGPAVRVTGASVKSGPAAVPVSQQDLIPPTLAYQKWIQARTVELVEKTDVLRHAVDRGDLATARAAWLPAHLVYERMGAAYGTFGDADAEINGTTAGLSGGVDDADFAGFHRVEYGLWHGESASSLRSPADRLAKAVHTLRDSWPGQRMDPADVGLRAHEILENALQFEMTGRTDYGSGTNLATARANLDGTRVLLGYLRPLLKTRDSGLAGLDSWMDRTQHTLDAFDHDGRWTPLSQLTRGQREKANADVGELVERLADVAALMDVRRTA